MLPKYEIKCLVPSRDEKKKIEMRWIRQKKCHPCEPRFAVYEGKSTLTIITASLRPIFFLLKKFTPTSVIIIDISRAFLGTRKKFLKRVRITFTIRKKNNTVVARNEDIQWTHTAFTLVPQTIRNVSARVARGVGKGEGCAIAGRRGVEKSIRWNESALYKRKDKKR